MTSVPVERETSYSLSNPLNQQNSGRGNSKLYLYNGSYRMVFVDNTNGKEYILDKNGKKLYLTDIALLQMQSDKEAAQARLMNSFEEQEAKHEKWKNHWFAKFQLANQNYDIFREAKKIASKGYQSILRKTGCSSFADLKEYQQINGGEYLKQAQTFLAQRSEAASGVIRSESDSIFYGRMYCDESGEIADIKTRETIAASIFSD